MIGAVKYFFRNISNAGLIGIFFYHFQFLWIVFVMMINRTGN